MSATGQNFEAIEETFSLTVDRYGRLWLHTKLNGIAMSIDLAPKDTAFEIMAAAMAENGFRHHLGHQHDPADNDDQAENGVN